MSIIKETIKLTGLDNMLQINIGGTNRLLGLQQEIDNLTEKTKTDLINPVVDNEVRRFQYDSTFGNPFYLIFYFSANGSVYGNSFVDAYGRFSIAEINPNNTKLQNSFFILDFYDTYDDNTQTKIFTIYQTQILDGEKSGITPIPKYRIYSNTVNQFYSWYVPKSYIDAQTGSTVTGYTKFSFYNAKYGDMTLFYNKANDGLSTPEKMYFKTRLNLDAMTWIFDFSGDATAYQVPFSSAYSQRVNNAVQSFDNEQQVYPSGNTFQLTDGTYTTV